MSKYTIDMMTLKDSVKKLKKLETSFLEKKIMKRISGSTFLEN